MQDYIEVMGLSKREYAALHGAGYVVGQSGDKCAGLYCRWIDTIISNYYSNTFDKIVGAMLKHIQN